MRKLLLKDPQLVRQYILRASRGSREQFLLHKLHCVLLVGLGRGCREVASWFGGSTRSIERWVGAFNRDGVEGLAPCRPGGRTPRLRPDAAQHIAFELRQPPCVCGYSELQWEGHLLMRHLSLHYGVSMSLRQCQRTLRRLRSTDPAAYRP